MRFGAPKIIVGTLAIALLAGCASQPREVVVRERVEERVLTPQPESLSQGPGDVISDSKLTTTSVRTTSSTMSPEYDSEEDADEFFDDLKPYGQWIDVAEYGPCWQPANLAPDWRPYTLGHWDYTEDAGWLWFSDEPFGWCCYHFGRWAFVTRVGWCWVPGHEWAAAWVVWRHGGGYVGWAPMPPVGSGIGIGVGIGISEPPPWAFCFVEDKYITEVNIREHIEPATRNVTLINVTKNITRYEVREGRVVNRGVDVEAIERASGRRVPRHRLADVDPRVVGLHRARPRTARAQPPPRREAGIAGARREPARFGSSAPRVRTPVEQETHRAALDAFHQRLLTEMQQRHERELSRGPPGSPREALLAQQARERRALSLQRAHQIETIHYAPRTLYRASAARVPIRRRDYQ
jgi:hypothetical protein